MKQQAPNPLIPQSLDADPEPRVWEDGRIYLYCSRDQPEGKVYCSEHNHVLSSDDLAHWTDHGISFSINDTPKGSGSLLYACDCIFRDGVYYLYYCTDNGSLGVASSESPTGPFGNARSIGGLDPRPGIDPAVFLDDDGQAYLYWGQQNNVRAARLEDNMVEIIPNTIMQPLKLSEHFFHEGAAMVKRDGIYYFIYADESREGRPSCIGYATGEAPFGPFTYRGVIIDNIGSDPNVWNNHGRIVEFQGQWYVFYHTPIQNGKCPRQTRAEPITFTENGLIPEVQMTSQGIGAPLDLTRKTAAYAVSRLTGHARNEIESEIGLCLGQIHDGDTAVYRGVCFSECPKNFTVRCSLTGDGGILEARLDDPAGKPMATLEFAGKDSSVCWQTLSATLDDSAPFEGKHTLHLSFKGNQPLSLEWFAFKA